MPVFGITGRLVIEEKAVDPEKLYLTL